MDYRLKHKMQNYETFRKKKQHSKNLSDLGKGS